MVTIYLFHAVIIELSISHCNIKCGGVSSIYASFDFRNVKAHEPILTFIAEVLETKQRKTASIDNVFTLQLRTDDSRIIELAKLPSDQLVKVSIFIEQT